MTPSTLTKPQAKHGIQAVPVAIATPPSVVARVSGVGAPFGALVVYADFGIQRIGRFGVVGVALLVFSASAYLTTILPLREQLVADRAVIEAADDVTFAEPVTVAVLGGAEQFLAQLPRRDELSLALDEVYAAAQSAGVDLERGDYTFLAGAEGVSVARYQLSFPVRGTYPQLRSFVSQALVAVPTMSLEAMKLARESVTESQIEAELSFAVLVRDER